MTNAQIEKRAIEFITQELAKLSATVVRQNARDAPYDLLVTKADGREIFVELKSSATDVFSRDRVFGLPCLSG